MTGALWRSALVAALFSVHPLGLESVAWIAERKNVLSTLFLLLTLCAYVGYTRKLGVLRYLLVALLLIMGLMSKPMLVTLPFALLLLDYWPLGRLGFAATSPVTEATTRRILSVARDTSLARVFFCRCAEKLPLLLLASGRALLTLKAQAMDSEIKFVSISSRVANALLSYGTYLWQMVWPTRLAIFYPYRDREIFSWPVMLCAASVCLISSLVVWQSKKRPYLAVGWFWYLGTLVPAMGLVHVGDIAHADRYTYVPLVGVFIAIVWGAADLGAYLATRFAAPRYALIAASGLAVVALATITIRGIFLLA